MGTDELERIRTVVSSNAERVKQLGEWSEWIDLSSLTARVPDWDKPAAGFDAGIACALNLIPEEKQKLSAKLHANYSAEAIAQVQREIAPLNDATTSDIITFSNTETCWWLAACNFCKEGDIDGIDFLDQIRGFSRVVANPKARCHHALAAFEDMKRNYTCVDDVAIALQDGGMQAAYIHGYDLAIQIMHHLWFIGTYKPSLGIPDDFEWGTSVDESGRPQSGPVHGSKQFVKCATFDELNTVLNFARKAGLGSAPYPKNAEASQ